jgi:DNA repair protein RadA
MAVNAQLPKSSAACSAGVIYVDTRTRSAGKDCRADARRPSEEADIGSIEEVLERIHVAGAQLRPPDVLLDTAGSSQTTANHR